MFLGNVINIILDPVFILLFDMGTTGAALATAIGQLIAALFFLFYVLRGHSSFSISPKDFKAGDGIAKDVFSIGIPAALVTLMMNFYQIISNAVMGRYGDLAVAAMGVGLKVSLIGSSISNGVGQGIQPLIAYQVGKKNKRRFKEILHFSCLFSLSVSIVLSILCFVFAEPIVSIFLTQPESVEMGVRFTRIILSTMWLSGLVNLLSFTIQAMDVPVQANIISLARNGYVGIAVVLLMSLFGSVYGVVAAQPVADVISFCIALVMLRISIRKCFPAEDGETCDRKETRTA
jgi:multidrug efflux pump